MDDERIIDLFWQRSEDAVTAVAGRFGAYCRSIAAHILHDGGDADECVNETWFRVWNAIPPARPSHLDAFLGKITRNIALNRYEAVHTAKRGRGSVEIALDELADIPTPETACDGEITRVIDAFLCTEPAEQADIFVKRYFYLRGVKDIAAEYGYKESKVASLLFRMRARLKTRLESEGLM
jgi:RNA polymerase sigma-70 factor (ECF subfamily)